MCVTNNNKWYNKLSGNLKPKGFKMNNYLSTEISIYWDIDIDNDLEIQEDLGLTPEQAASKLSDTFERMEVYSNACEYYGLPHSVDMSEYFDDPHSVASSRITDALSDDFGWNVKDFKWLVACN